MCRRPPSEVGACGWTETLPPLPPPQRLETVERADCAVVGAGFTGLAAARRLAALRPGWRVVVVDAGRRGSGASGRSSGFVVALAHFVARMRPPDARRFIRLSRTGIAALHSLVAEHDIDCAWDDLGWIHAAAGEAAVRSLDGLDAWLRNLGEPFERLDRATLRALTGSTYYRSGLHLPGSILVQPAALLRGLAESLPPNVELYEESPVHRLVPGTTVRLEAGRGTLEADRVVVATNGYSRALGLLRRRIFPLVTFGSLTRRLDSREQSALGGAPEWGLLAEDPLGSTLRRTRDQRLLVRNTVRYGGGSRSPSALLEAVRESHRQALTDRFPHLGGVRLEHTWGGTMGMSYDHNHFFGRLAPNLAAAAGFSGAGIALGTVSGQLLADLLAGVDSDELRDMMALPHPAWIPPEPALGLGVRFRLARLAARAGGRI